MDVSNLGSIATQMSQFQLGDSVQTAVLKKAMDIEKQLGLQMLETLPQDAPGNPPHLGNTIDVRV